MHPTTLYKRQDYGKEIFLHAKGTVGSTTGCGNRNWRVNRRLSRACLPEQPVANTERANASNSVVSAALLRLAQRSCVTTAVMLTFGYRKWVSVITKERVRDC